MDKKDEKNTLDGRYIEAVGRRKTAIARVRISEGKSSVVINGKSIAEYFPTEHLQRIAAAAFEKLNMSNKFAVSAKIIGGGVNAQAEAFRHGAARAIIAYDAELRKTVKKLGFLRRDPRAKERRKFGLKKARKAPQWAKR